MNTLFEIASRERLIKNNTAYCICPVSSIGNTDDIKTHLADLLFTSGSLAAWRSRSYEAKVFGITND